MIKVLFSGGLGNQMFQYAFYLWLKKNYSQIRILADLTPYKSTEFHTGFELERIFQIKLPQKSLKEKYNLIEKYYYKILFRINTMLIFNGISKYKILQGNDHSFNKDILHINKHKCYYMQGVWNSPLYFRGVEDEIKQSFKFDDNLSPSNLKIQNLIYSHDSISIHVRRGDYLNSTYVTLSETDYYKKALDFLIKKLDNSNNIFIFIFSDDAEWCKRNFSFLNEYNHIYITQNSGKNSFRDMQLMSLCKYNIIANSTFSWWAAWLNSNKEKLIICPKSYFIYRNYNEKFLKYHYPKEWILI